MVSECLLTSGRAGAGGRGLAGGSSTPVPIIVRGEDRPLSGAKTDYCQARSWILVRGEDGSLSGAKGDEITMRLVHTAYTGAAFESRYIYAYHVVRIAPKEWVVVNDYGASGSVGLGPGNWVRDRAGGAGTGETPIQALRCCVSPATTRTKRACMEAIADALEMQLLTNTPGRIDVSDWS